MYIKNITRWFLSFSPIKTIYFNFKYLPLKQAWKLPVILENVRLHSLKGEVFIDEDVIYTGMIRIGSPIMINYWCPKKQSDIDLQGGRLVLHKGIKFGLGTHLRVHDNALLNIGRFVCSSSGLNLICYYKILIGNSTKIGWDTIIMDTDYHPMHDMISGKLTKIYAPINIGNDCWFGTGCYVSKGCKIANGTTFAAHSVVRSSVTRENCICAGNPAVIIEEGYRISEETFSYHPPVKKKAY